MLFRSFSRISLQRANLDFLLCFISKSNCNDPVLNFTASVEGRSSWLGRNWKLMSGTGSLNQVELSKTGYSLRLPGTVAITAKDGLLQSGSGILEGEDSKLEFRLRGMVDGSEIENRLKGSLSLKFLEFLTPLIEEGRGKMRLNLGLEGEVRDAAFSGNINIEDEIGRAHV